ncbi:DUF305 domain-containing protein [Conexibacter sp. SYSU D00693]|uniref:DUF305 domain-containing protein n=1 Tax=Conexibacter sp. SYSU D00693 TaxID=2812560 RepID=UPI00196A4EA9|nr:DUF305 domain-containing protein [Conexibacter sp. SYSU D00693]
MRLVLQLPAVLTAFVLAACGGQAADDQAEHGPGGATHTGTATTAAATGQVDRAFVAAMVPHHEAAIEMARLAQGRARSSFVRDLARGIARSQRAEVATMRSRDRALAAQGAQAGDLGVPHHAMGMDDDPAQLRDAADVDEAFLTMMVPHHEGAIAMARAELARGTDPALRRLAATIARDQAREVRTMRRHLDGDHRGGEHAAEGH